MKWQPISTAPKDGTLIDLYCAKAINTPSIHMGAGRVVNCKWAEGWVSDFGYLLDESVTHWMPLPPQPEDDQHG